MNSVPSGMPRSRCIEILLTNNPPAEMKTEVSVNPAEKSVIPEWELAVLDVFVRAAAMFGFRKSVALVYGALYCSREPLSAQEIQERLQISRGSTVEALLFLRRLGAARVCLKIGERRDYFTAETDLKKFVQGFLKEILVPALEKADIRLAQAEESAGKISAVPAADAAFARSRVAELTLWKSRLTEALPLLDGLLNTNGGVR